MRPVERKVGFANRAMWPVLKLDMLVWAHMYDDTVQYANCGQTSVAIGQIFSPRIEPEVVFKLKQPLARLKASMEVCPTDILLAPAERIWHLLTDPRKLAQWTGTTLVDGPARPMNVGDHLVLRAHMLRVTFDVRDMRPPRELTLDVGLPFGVTNHEQIQITPIDAHSSRVTFN